MGRRKLKRWSMMLINTRLKMKNKRGADDKKTIVDKCNDVISWLDANQLAEQEEFEHKQKELEGICNPIITKLYQSAGGAPGWYARWYARLWGWRCPWGWKCPRCRIRQWANH